jgi:anthranilate synthase/aminodeoxychorismate synthase-like glutamine amidotransferase
MILIIDNYDSFTYNLYQQIAAMGHTVKVVKHDAITVAQIIAMQPTHIVISPGPKRPRDSGISNEVIRQFYKTIPILGVCLGHQCIGEIFGSHTVEAPVIVHGKAGAIQHTKTGLFKGLPDPFMAARYNSLVLDTVPNEFRRTAWSGDGSIMAIQHEQYQLYGVQFHPESFMTPLGDVIMRNFLQCTT